MRLLMVLLILLLYSTAYAGQGMYPVPMAYPAGAAADLRCEGWPSTLSNGNCEFDAPVPDTASLTGDRTYMRTWEPTYDGKALTVAFETGANVPTPNGLWAVVYVSTGGVTATLVCSQEYTGPLPASSTIYMDLPADCDFAGNTILMGFAMDPSGEFEYKRDDDGGGGLRWTDDDLSGGPVQNITYDISSSRTMGFNLKTEATP